MEHRRVQAWHIDGRMCLEWRQLGLKCVHPTPETSLTYLDGKTWGMGWGKTWWACAPSDDLGLDRKATGRAIVLQDSAWCRHGFSSRNRSAALAAIAQAIESQGLKVPDAPNLKAAGAV